MCKAVEDFAKEQMAKSRLEGIEEGRLKGKAEGRLEGIAEGTIRGKIEAIRNMLSRGIELTEALALTGLDRKTYEEFSSN